MAKAKSPKLKVDKISGSSARVSFAKVAGSSQYQIRYRVKGKKWVRKDVKSSKKRVSVKISRLRSGKKYQVSARVLTNGKPGKWSAAKTFATKKVWGKISEKSIVIRRNAKNTAFTITFKPVKKAKSYSVRYRLNANGQKWKTKTVKKGKGKKQKITLKKLKPGKKYCLQLRALKGKKKGPWTRKIYANTFSGGSNSTEAAKASAKVKKYSYEVRPLIAPFNGTVFVKTDNPDPDSFAFIDKKSKYIEKPEALVRNAILSLNTGEYEDEGTGIFSRLTRCTGQSKL